MKIVRHVARDMRQAMRAIRERLGEEAVILSSRRVGDGVEVTAAVDFDAAALEAQSIQEQVAERLAMPQESRAAARADGGAEDGAPVSLADEDQLIREDLAQIIRGAAPVARTPTPASAKAPAAALAAP